jgi:hypothetical protein
MRESIKLLTVVLIFIFLSAVFCCLLVWAINGSSPLFSVVGKPVIPEALHGLETDTVKIIWQEDLSKWNSELSKGKILTLYEAQLIENGLSEVRVVFGTGERQQYFGKLQSQFKGAPIQTIWLEIQESQFIIGRVDKSLSGDLTFISIRGNTENGQFPDAKKTSVINKRIFFFPIFVDELTQWQSITWLGIKTEQSSRDAMKSNTLDFYAWEENFNPPVASFKLLRLVETSAETSEE